MTNVMCNFDGGRFITIKNDVYFLTSWDAHNVEDGVTVFNTLSIRYSVERGVRCESINFTSSTYEGGDHITSFAPEREKDFFEGLTGSEFLKKFLEKGVV